MYLLHSLEVVLQSIAAVLSCKNWHGLQSTWLLRIYARVQGTWPPYFYKFLSAFAKLQKALSCLSVRPPIRMSSAPTATIFTKFYIWELFKIENLSRKIQLSLKYDKNNWYSTWRPTYIYNISLNSCWNEECFRRKSKRKSEHVLCSIMFFKKSCHLWDNV